MAKPTRARGRRAATGLLLAALALGWGCASPIGPLDRSYDYFAAPDPRDPWSRKIRYWQDRERFDRGEHTPGAPAAVAGSGEGEAGTVVPEDLEEKYREFRARTRRAQAREIAGWIQEQSRHHYVPDGPIDRWATTAETLRRNGDDCDGLELLTYHLLRDLGFGNDRVYRAIVYRRSDGQHHMVTLWFENPNDPWVIDPTGAMTSGMPRMSQVAGWEPLKVFSEDEDFTVLRGRVAATSPARRR